MIFKSSFGIIKIKKSRLIRIVKGDVSIKKVKKIKEKKGRKLESWYHMLLFGYPFVSLGDGDSIKKSMALSIDFLRFYWRLGKSSKLIAGVGISGSAFVSEIQSDRQLNLYLYGAGIQYYFKKIGVGWFARGDIGISSGSITENFKTLSSSGAGFGFLAGFGYAFRISWETSFVLQLAYQYYGISPEFHTIGLNAGWLW